MSIRAPNLGNDPEVGAESPAASTVGAQMADPNVCFWPNADIWVALAELGRLRCGGHELYPVPLTNLWDLR